MTTESFIEKAKHKHGEKYDYSDTTYEGCYTHVNIMCAEHGAFSMTAAKHLSGQGCRLCGVIKRTKSNANMSRVRLTTEEFIRKAVAIHGDMYDYSRSVYKNDREKILIICPFHGEVFMIPSSHLRYGGCTLCRTMPTAKFVSLAKEKHGDLYDYSKVDYSKSREHVVITCVTHGDFSQSPNAHLQGTGCPLCANLLRGSSQRLDISDCMREAASKNGKCISEEYKNSQTHMEWECAVGHRFMATYSKISNKKNGTWCPYCGRYKSEESAREMFQAKFGVSFPKCRPEWLRNPLTGHTLELDGFNEELLIAFEYNGKQHYEYIEHFHSGDVANFERQVERDKVKESLCAEHSVKLFVIDGRKYDYSNISDIDFDNM
jgi:hypothetical protein